MCIVGVGVIAVDIPNIFKWADPMAKFWPTRAVAEDIRKVIRARYSLDEWEQVSKPLHDELRMKQRDALISFLLVQPQLIQWGVIDADSLFEFFLIDVQMGACLKTSRMKQAISSVQTFVQRCFLGLETGKILAGIPRITPETLDRERWKWMQKQTLWAANMKVLINCEDYLVASLRDDKSLLYGALENGMKQKDINPETLQDSIKTYISGWIRSPTYKPKVSTKIPLMLTNCTLWRGRGVLYTFGFIKPTRQTSKNGRHGSLF